MGKIGVIYKSRYGFTKKYAEWIAKELGAELRDAANTKPADLQAYDVILYGGGLYAGVVNGLSLLTKSFESIADKSLYLFTVGAADVTDEQNTNHIRAAINKVLTPEMQRKIKVYHFRGGIDYPRLNFVHRLMMGAMIKRLKKKPESEWRREDKEFIETYGQIVDFSDKTSIEPLILDVNASGSQ